MNEKTSASASLSDKRKTDDHRHHGYCYFEDDVREAVRKLKEGIPMTTTQAGMKSKDYWKGVNDMIKRADEIFGEKLC